MSKHNGAERIHQGDDLVEITVTVSRAERERLTELMQIRDPALALNALIRRLLRHSGAQDHETSRAFDR